LALHCGRFFLSGVGYCHLWLISRTVFGVPLIPILLEMLPAKSPRSCSDILQQRRKSNHDVIFHEENPTNFQTAVESPSFADIRTAIELKEFMD
uniref:Uncharacterized protein n=1 Tax=Parascaris univalens TaxID=6257 RepID=A0A915BEI5_PARUN